MLPGLGQFSAFVESSGDLGTVAHSTARMHTEIPVRLQMKATLTARRGWLARPGTLALAGAVHLPGMRAEIIFRKNPDRDLAPESAERVAATIVNAGHAIPLLPQRLPFTPRSEAELWMRVHDPTRQPSWTAHFLGRSPGHPLTLDRQLWMRATLDASFKPEEFAGERRTRIEIDGELRFDGDLIARFLSLEAGHAAPPGESDLGEVELLTRGTAVRIGRHVVWGVAGPNPWISVRILEADGKVMAEEHALGRSVRVH